MRYTISPEEMQALERQYMAHSGVPGILLMEHAAQGIVHALTAYAPGGTALFLCGPGNNGGDGYAAARLWQAAGGTSLIWELSDQAKGDAQINRLLALQQGIQVHLLSTLPERLPPCDVVVDALFGTGLCRPVTGLPAELIRLVNASGRPCVAVDIPSGLSGQSGAPLGETIRAVETITFHRIKQGLLLGQAPRYTGRLTVHPILIPPAEGNVEGLHVLEEDDLPLLLPRRDALAHKGDYGRVAILAGSVGMAGAAALCARACVKAGAGLTTILCREALWPVMQTLVPAAMCVPLHGSETELAPESIRRAAEVLSKADRVVVGCGLSTAPDMLPLLHGLTRLDRPVIWDADALNLLAAHPEWLPLKPSHLITPHVGEAARLLQVDAAEILADPLHALRALQQRAGCCALLKGARTLMTDGLHTAINPIGTPALAKGGSGDVLAGVLGALCGRVQGGQLEWIQTAVTLHSLAGQRAAEQYGEDCVTPETLIEHLTTQP